MLPKGPAAVAIAAISLSQVVLNSLPVSNWRWNMEELRVSVLGA